MKATTSMSTYRLHRAIAQLVGDMECLAQEVWTTDVAQYLGVTKQTARKHIKRMVKDGILTENAKRYKGDIPVLYYSLTNNGWMMHNSETAKEAKSAVFAMRGILL